MEQAQQQEENAGGASSKPPPFATVASLAPREVEEDYQVAPIEAFVKDDDDGSVEEIDAENIDVLPTRSEVAQKARKRLRLYSIVGSLCVIITTIGVMVPISLTILRVDPDLTIPSDAPSSEPSIQPSISPTGGQYSDYVDVFSQVSDVRLIRTPGSPQYRASRWIYDFDPARRAISDARLIQRYIAAVFYYSTSNGSGWADCYPGDVGCTSDSKESWFSSHDECDWFGFRECNDNGFVTSFYIMNNQNGEGKTYHGNNLHGTLPSEFGYLTNLTDLTIVKNPFLTSTIPTSFSNLTKLRRLRLMNNGLQGPWFEGLLRNMTKLVDVGLKENQFNISLPLDIADVRSLNILTLSGNKFHGKIPIEYGKLHRLETLELHANKLTGTIPSELFFPNLQVLSLQDNNIDGTMPETICNMTKENKLHSLMFDCEFIQCDCCSDFCEA
eukprot:CAMPEP_0203667280 /NCGR_PEP_ID=MMETSP0090-20130426/4150_1 /ASSEMBLY_ACC=CAM_ASM_001088 /TAXON_ID=426623 /ORGANISM="Chaetoceros affinis, Strain CCMP159" /LENGTH=442 /DNA_ID=CAMNT_0050531399 /DNA_START=119 /DNA_END=1447 /DNA_ORIENTATION=-